MARAFWPKADQTSQWYGDDYSDSVIEPNILVIHTTEGPNFPGYSGNYPHLTGLVRKRGSKWRQHQRFTRSARALQNDPGGVETNTLNAVQVELVGTCSRKTHWKWRAMGVRHIYWPKAPEWALREVGRMVAEVRKRCPEIPLKDAAPRGWLSYPESYGDSRVRMRPAEWVSAYGLCGHQHVPENAHGDPGDIDVEAIIHYAKGGDLATRSERRVRRRRHRKHTKREKRILRELRKIRKQARKGDNKARLRKVREALRKAREI